MTTLFKRVASQHGNIQIVEDANLTPQQLEQGGHAENILLTEGAAEDGGGLCSPLTEEEAQALRAEAEEQRVADAVAGGVGNPDVLEQVARAPGLHGDD